MTFSKTLTFLALTLILVLAGCQAGNGGDVGGNNGSTNTDNPIPTLSSMTPTATVTHMPDFSLEVTGSNFVNGAKVVFNNTELNTTYISSTQLSCTVYSTAAAMSSPGGENLYSPQKETVTVLVRNPSPGGGDSGSLDFTIHDNFSFASPVALSDANHKAERPQIWVASDGMVDVTWGEVRGSSNSPVYMRHSSDGGASWGSTRTVYQGNCSCPAICRDNSGTLHCAFSYTANPPGSVLRYCTSTDNGATWTQPVTIPNSQIATGHHPQMLVGDGTTIHMISSTSEIYAYCSSDNGQSWGPPVQVSNNYHAPNWPQADIDIQGNLFVIWTQPDGQNSQKRRVWFSRSMDGGSTWLTPTILRSADYEGLGDVTITAATNQHLVSAWTWTDDLAWSTRKRYLELRFANKYGNTWSAIKTMQPNGNYGMNPSLSADSAGNVNLFMANADIHYPLGIFKLRYIRSTDNGSNWTDSVFIKNVAQPTTLQIKSACDAAGHVYVSFVDNLGGFDRVYFSRSEIPN